MNPFYDVDAQTFLVNSASHQSQKKTRLHPDVSVKRSASYDTTQYNSLISKRSREDIAEGERKGIDKRENVAPLVYKKGQQWRGFDLMTKRMAKGSFRTSILDNETRCYANNDTLITTSDWNISLN